MSGTFDHEDSRPHSVYRCYDADDQLLYIGCAWDVDHRIWFHMQRSSQSEVSWAVRRRMARYTSQEYPTKAAARSAEREAIANEAPLLNRQHNPRRFRKTPDGRYATPAHSP